MALPREVPFPGRPRNGKRDDRRPRLIRQQWRAIVNRCDALKLLREEAEALVPPSDEQPDQQAQFYQHNKPR